MRELVPLVPEFEGKPVTFISLMVSGWSSGELPTAQFLKEWQQKHAIPFEIAASPRDPGKEFYQFPVFPNAVIIDQTNKLAFKSARPGVSRILQEVRRLVD